MRNVFATLLITACAATCLLGQVTSGTLHSAQGDPQSWLMYGRNYSGWRYSQLDEINTSTVKNLAPAWVFQSGVNGSFRTTPLVRDGIMYATGYGNHAWALDLLSGRPLWSYSSPPPPDVQGCCAQPNRGFAILGDTLFKVNFEATLVALDTKTGDGVPPIRWTVLGLGIKPHQRVFPRSAPATDERAKNAAGAGCKILRCSRKRPVEPPLGCGNSCGR